MRVQVGTIIKPDGTESTVRPANGKRFSLKELQEMVGGFIELVPMKSGNAHKTLYVNEDGKYNGSAPNYKATAMANINSFDFITGTAVVVKNEKQENPL